MESDRPSRTLLRTAIRRASHQVLDTPVILDDPVALALVPEAADPDTLAALLADGAPEPALLRSLFAMRSRFAEDRLAEAASRGVRQYVMLGAGLDTFPWRQPDFARAMRLFAADHPASLAWTRGRLRERGFAEPPNLAFVPVDLDGRDPGMPLAAAGFDAAAPAFLAMLGVAQYLAPGSIERVLGFAAALPSGSEIVLSFALPDDELSAADRAAAARSTRFTASLGEPWKTRLRPRDLAARLAALGFSDVFHLAPELARRRYFADRRDALRAPGWEQLIAAVR